MKNLTSKILIGLFCFALGMGVMLLGQRYLKKSRAAGVPTSSPTSPMEALAKADPLGAPLYASQTTNNPAPSASNGAPNPDPFFSDPFGQMRAVEKQMQAMQARMMKQLDHPGFGDGFFNSWKIPGFQNTAQEAGSTSTSSGTSIHQREDKNYVYYDIAIKNLGQSKVNVKVSDGQINVSGQIDQKTKDNGSESEYSSSFQQSFPVPPDVDANKVQMSRTKGLVTLKFPKVDASG